MISEQYCRNITCPVDPLLAGVANFFTFQGAYTTSQPPKNKDIKLRL